MTEVGPADRSRLLRSKRAECSSIVTSRKRKLHELFAVATGADGVLNHISKAPDVPRAADNDAQLLLDAEALQGQILGDFTVPPRPEPRFDALQRYLAASAARTAKLAAAKQLFDKALPPCPAPQPAVEREQKGERSAAKLGHELVLQETAQGRTAALRAVPAPSEPARPVPGAESGVPKATTERLGVESTDISLQPPPTSVESTAKGSGSVQDTRGGQEPIQNGTTAHSPAPAQPVEVAPESKHPLEGVAAASVGLEPHGAGSVVHPTVEGVASDEMDIDAPRQNGEREAVDISDRLPPPELSKVPDALSSPGSTAQTVTTPAVHEASTDTSPDNEGPQYIDTFEEKAEQASEPDRDRAAAQAEAPADGIATPESSASPSETQGGGLHDVDAQLLRESAAAANEPRSQEPATEGQTVVRSKEVAVEPAVRDDTASTSPGHGLEAGMVKPSVSSSMGPPPTSPKPVTADAREPGAHQEPSMPEPMALDQREPQVADASVDLSGTAPTVAETEVVTQPPVVLPVPTAVQAAQAAITAPIDSSKGSAMTEARQEPSQHPSYVAGSLPPVEAKESVLASKIRALAFRKNAKAKNRTPVVVFGKQKHDDHDKDKAVVDASKSDNIFAEDYFTPIFIQAFGQKKGLKSLEELLNHANKTISTSDAFAEFLDNQTCKILKRVYNLQQQDKWSLRQPKRCPEPTRPPSHWDVLLQEMRWMRTDFREERKWKRTVARNLARACAEWVASTPEERKALQVNAFRPPPVQARAEDMPMADGIGDEEGTHLDAIPGLTPSGDADSPVNHDHDQELGDNNLMDTVAPSLIFAMPDDDVVFALNGSAAADRLLEELPLYGAPLKVPKFDLTAPEYDPDAHWRRPVLPLSKYVEGKIVLSDNGPPRKKSRFEYSPDEGDKDNQVVVGAPPPRKPVSAQGGNKPVGLFDPDMKPIRDRLYAGHQFRPPSEHPMPLQSFYEARPPSQWTWAEDDQLKALVREHSYNWSLISSIISGKSIYQSGAERRTPWECFERWVHLEGLPTDMSKTQYFKTYQNRIEAAQRVIKEHYEKAAQAQQASANGSSTPLLRRRVSTTMRVERRRNQKHLALIDSMRKLFKKREAALQKQQHAAALAATRKPNELQQQSGPAKTPGEYSIMRWKRDQQLAEKMANLMARQSEQRRQMAARSQGGQLAAANGGPTPVPPQVAAHMAAAAAAANPIANTVRANIPSQLAIPGQRPRMPMQATPNGMAGGPAHMGGGLVAPIPMNGLPPQAQLQAMQQAHRMQMGNPQPDINLILQARRIQDQQRTAVQLQQHAQHQQHHQQQQHHHQQQQQQHPQQHVQSQQTPQQQAQQAQQVPQGHHGAHGSPNPVRPVINGINQQNYMANAMMAASLGAAGGAGMGTPPAGGLNMASMPAGSPRANGVLPQQQLSPAMMAQIRELENSFKAKNPALTTEQARNLAFTNYSQLVMMQRANAMSAASGTSPHQGLVNGMSGSSPHQYAQLLRAQQQAQAAAAAAAAVQQQQQQQSAQQQRQPIATPMGTPTSK